MMLKKLTKDCWAIKVVNYLRLYGTSSCTLEGSIANDPNYFYYNSLLQCYTHNLGYN